MDKRPENEETESAPAAQPATPILPATRDDDSGDALPPPAVAGRGPMDQSVPDVATGSTPVTRCDD